MNTQPVVVFDQGSPERILTLFPSTFVFLGFERSLFLVTGMRILATHYDSAGDNLKNQFICKEIQYSLSSQVQLQTPHKECGMLPLINGSCTLVGGPPLLSKEVGVSRSISL